MHRNSRVPVFGEMIKKGVPSRLALCVEYKSPESGWDARGEVASQREEDQDNRCQPLQAQPQIYKPRWPREGSRPRAPIWALHGLPGFLAHLTNFLVEPPRRWTLSLKEDNTPPNRCLCQELPVNLSSSLRILPLRTLHGFDSSSWARLTSLKVAIGWPLII